MGSTTSSIDIPSAVPTNVAAPVEVKEKTIEELGQNVVAEVLRARQMWGTEFDLKNTLNDWSAYVNYYLAMANSMGATKEQVTKGLRKAAGLVLSALYHAENDLLAARHYDGQERPESPPEIKT